MTMFRTVSGALTIYAGDPRPVHFPFFDAAGAPQSLSGRRFVFAVRRDILTQAIFDPIPMILSGDGYYVTAPITADQATAIYEAGVGYPIVYDVIETTAGASTTRWTGRISAQPSTALPSDAPPRWIDLPVAELVSDGPVVRVSERGAAGPGVEQRLKDLGDITEADPALMRDKIREWGGEGGAPFAEAADAAAQAAVAARHQAENLVEPVQDIVDNGASAIAIDGNGQSLSPSAILTGAQAVLPIHFKSSNIYRTKRALIAAHIAGDSLIDDGPRLTAAIFDALKKGRDIIVTEPIWCNTGAVVTAEGTLLKIIGMGEGSIIGGPGVVGPIVKASNIADVGETFARSIDAIVNNIRFDARFVPGGNLTSADCLNLNGFRLTHIDQCDFYAADHFYGSDKGDAGAGLRGHRVVVSRSNFWGFLDAGLYLTANPDGSLDNTSALFFGNNFYGCRGGWAAKRAFEYIRSVGDYFDNCFNSFSTAPASSSNPVTGFTNAARKVSVKGAQIDNPISSAIDLRRAYDSHVDAVISGTIGRYPDGTSPAEVNIVKLLGTSRSRIDFVIDNEDPSIVAATTAVRIERTVNEDTGLDEGATDNVINGTVRRVNTGLIEGSLCDRNEVTLKMIGVPDLGTTTGALTRYGFSRDGVPWDRARYRRAPRKLFDYYHATANDSGWTGEDSWLGGQIYETDDASGATGERVRIGARATGSSGSAVAASMQVDGAVILDARSDQVKCQKALVIPALASADVPTPAANSFALFFEGGILKSKNSTGAVAAV